jgi:hypothetical protein
VAVFNAFVILAVQFVVFNKQGVILTVIIPRALDALAHLNTLIILVVAIARETISAFEVITALSAHALLVWVGIQGHQTLVVSPWEGRGTLIVRCAEPTDLFSLPRELPADLLFGGVGGVGVLNTILYCVTYLLTYTVYYNVGVIDALGAVVGISTL